MEKRVILDSSVWVASLILEEPNHYEAIRTIGRHINKGYRIIIPWVVMMEVVNVANRLSVPKEKINHFVWESIKNDRFVIPEIDAYTLFHAMEILIERIKLRTMDLIIITHARLLQPTDFVSFDKTQLKCYIQIIHNQ